MEGQWGTRIITGGYICWTWGNTQSPKPHSGGYNTSHGHTQTIPDGHSAPEPIHTQQTPHTQAKDPKTSENCKEPRMKRRPNHS